MIRAHVTLGIRRGSLDCERTRRTGEAISDAVEVEGGYRCQGRRVARLQHWVHGSCLVATRYGLDVMDSEPGLPRRWRNQEKRRRNIVVHCLHDEGRGLLERPLRSHHQRQREACQDRTEKKYCRRAKRHSNTPVSSQHEQKTFHPEFPISTYLSVRKTICLPLSSVKLGSPWP